MNTPPKNPAPTGVNPAAAPARAPGGHPMGAPQGNRPAQRPMQPNPNMRPGAPMQGRPMQPNPNMRPMPRQAVPQNAPYTNPTPQPQQGQATVQEAPQSAQTAQKQERSRYEPNFASDFNLSPSVIKTKGYMLVMLCALIIGILFGTMMGGGSSQPVQQTGGLKGVVRNKDITSKMPRCGLTEKGQACLLYIMNSTRYDKVAEDFFDEAVKLMGMQKYSISMVNPTYAKDRIPPGYFAEIKIPMMR